MSLSTRAAILFVLVTGSCDAASQWLRLTTPHFELYTDTSEKAGRDAIEYFEQVRGFFLKASPVRIPDGFPVRIIAFNSREQFIPYSPHALNIAYYTPGARRDYIVMSDLSPESYKVAVHEYMHLIVRHSGLRIPTWLNEGWADVYSSLRPVKDGVAVGDLIPGRMQVLSQGPWLDFNTLTSVVPGSPIYNEGDRTGLFYGESWALTHMLFLAPDYKDNFGKFVIALHRGSSAAEACQIAYGKPAAEVFADLRKYFDRRKLYGAVFKTTLAPAESEPRQFDTSEFELRLVLADLQSAIGHTDVAKREYEDLEKLQPNRPDLSESLGYIALSRKDVPQAREYFGRAFASGANDPQMCMTLANLEIAAKQPPAKVIPILERAVQSKPDYTDALLQLGLQRVAARQFEGAVNTLMSIPNVTPERATGLFFALAYSYLETGDVEKARENAGNAKKWAKTPEETQRLAQLSEFIEARAKLSTPPHPGEKLQSAQGTLQSLDCAANGNRLRLQAGGQNLTFGFPDPKAIEFTATKGGVLSLRCGAQQPVHVLVEYAPVSVMETGVTGVIRRLEY